MPFDNVVFINYVPGSYGTFLYHCLQTKPRLDIFNSDGSAHRKLLEVFPNFHNHYDLKKWLELTDDQKYERMREFESIHSTCAPNAIYIQRVTYPKATLAIQKFFPGAKIIKINIDNHSIYHVAEKFISKVANIPIGDAIGFICDNINNEEIEGVYDLGVINFLNGNIIPYIDGIRGWLGLPKADITQLYEEFKKVNGITNDKMVL